jgi:hypothetical protein
MSDWGWALTGALVVATLSVLVEARLRQSGRGGPSILRAGLGASITLATVASGIALAGVRSESPPEQRGIGVRVDGAHTSPDRRGDKRFDMGLTLAMAVDITACDEPVRVRLTLAPTAEFWIDNQEKLADGATVRLAIPDDLDADVPADRVLQDLRAWVSTDGLAPFVAAVRARSPGEPGGDGVGLEAPATRRVARATFVTIEVPRWGDTPNPLNLEFTADWTRRRTLLGSCYVTLPALAGFPTVLSAVQMEGEATPLEEAPGGRLSFFVVSSTSADLHAYYRTEYEVTHGVTSLTMPGHTLQDGVSLPAPNANLGRSPAWTCRTTIPDGLAFLPNTRPGDAAVDVNQAPSNDGTFALSDARIAEILEQETCASFVAIESTGAGTRRDFVLMAIGALFALGIELFLSGLRRRRTELPT